MSILITDLEVVQYCLHNNLEDIHMYVRIYCTLHCTVYIEILYSTVYFVRPMTAIDNELLFPILVSILEKSLGTYV